MQAKKLIPYLIVIVPFLLVLALSFFMTTFYMHKVTAYFEQAKVNFVQDYINLQKSQSQQTVEQLSLLFEYTKNRVKPLAKKELQTKVELAYKIATNIHEKNKKKQRKKLTQIQIKDALSEMVFDNDNNFIFITNYSANPVLKGSHLSSEKIADYLDADYRSIILEEIQKVRRHNAGYIESKRGDTKAQEIIYVKDLGFYKWYIGSSVLLQKKEEQLKKKLLEMLKNMPIEKRDFISLIEGDKKLYGSDDFRLQTQDVVEGWNEDKKNPRYFYVKYFKEFDWYLIHGFTTSTLPAEAQKKFQHFENMLDDELLFIRKISLIIIAITLLLSLLLSLKINKIFKTYQRELENLNSSLELRVAEEVKEHKEKEKLLLQSAKMAEMGDMLSMIAHQWRQPLNQLSYVVMNIESAYEYDELTKDYLDTKVKEANELLEFISVTIDEFRNYFKPDKERELVAVKELVSSTLFLIQKVLEKESIELKVNVPNDLKIEVYKNEFIQVLLNLIKNSRDALSTQEKNNKYITIEAKELQESLLISVSDNGGGIDEKIIEKIFEPYFSTKEQKNGTGLGLYMSKMILERGMGAKLEVINSKDGVTFNILIPLKTGLH